MLLFSLISLPIANWNDTHASHNRKARYETGVAYLKN